MKPSWRRILLKLLLKVAVSITVTIPLASVNFLFKIGTGGVELQITNIQTIIFLLLLYVAVLKK
ncbi:MAG: hypothetical protein B6U76_01475 [Desulfurococcales archaeon ex4484_217_2]|nr:MAG: hypothetical protein B6U76_01475 [Desulfurococcales archaeon ex4484_217_2]